MKNRISILREEKGLSQQQLAKKTGLTRQAISLYELGRRVPSSTTAAKLSRFFEVDIAYLMGLDNDKENYAKQQKRYFEELWRKIMKIDDFDNRSTALFAVEAFIQMENTLIDKGDYRLLKALAALNIKVYLALDPNIGHWEKKDVFKLESALSKLDQKIFIDKAKAKQIKEKIRNDEKD